MMRIALILLLTFLVALPVRAESLIVTLSERTVDITSNFTGSAITVFGAVRRDAATVPRASDYDVVVTVTGPQSDRVTRLKERVLGVWVNTRARTFEGVPSAYTVLSNRPVSEIAHSSLLRRFQIGIEQVLSPEEEDDNAVSTDNDSQGENDSQADAPETEGIDPRVFERAFLRLQREARVYQEDPNAVAVIDNTLFRARATFPADVPLGLFDVNVYLFSGGVLLAEERVGILVRKTGFEQFIFRMSQRDQLMYGGLAVVLALFTGWLGSVVFRRS
ncbi:MAG: TIGR02186 family protein [Rhizobiales bacterium]|nr:TIGR02186 family protein [Hyphomicrobiales bacterium]MBO6699145.1 TIGR02186 family protein [Hyphomicrobiales bacterium]MBO6736683.1 TIGR02186 family protein [Hyphomicrobiales bacterium]MBO6912243.1 TIGR02186 family protein [Hyphomicrobiales bacterium]MBO6956246.1 TIGR02186 family protein [Hyphomicrobiales bacterium]